MLNKKNKTKIKDKNKLISNNSIKLKKNTPKKINHHLNFVQFWKIAFFVFIVLILLSASAVSIWKGNINTYDSIYKGAWGLNVQVEKYSDPSDPTSSTYYNGKDATIALKNKLNPLGNKKLKFKYSNDHQDPVDIKDYSVVNVETAINSFTSKENFKNEAARPGYLYFINDKSGTDLLVKGTKRTAVSKVIGGATSGIDKSRKPVLNLKIIDTKTWTDSVITPTKSDGLDIWDDIPYFINDLRNISDYDQFQHLLIHFRDNPSIMSDPYANDVFTFKDNDITKPDHNLLTITSPEELKTDLKLKNKNWKIPTVSKSSLGTIDTLSYHMNPNDTAAVSNNYIDPFRPFLDIIMDDTTWINIDQKFSKYRLSEKSTKSSSTDPKIYSISMDTATVAKQTASLIDGSLKGLEFNVISTYNVNPLIKTWQFNVSFILFCSILILISLFLIFYYRLFGFIFVLSMILLLSLMYLVLGILAVELGPALILAIIIILFLSFDSNITFFEHFKKEHYINKASNKFSFKLANKKTILSILDYHLILFIAGLIIFWVGSGALEMFAVSIVIAALFSFFITIFITRLFYYLIIKYKWLDQNSSLTMVNKFFKFKFFNKKNTTKSANDKKDLSISDNKNHKSNDVKNDLDIKTDNQNTLKLKSELTSDNKEISNIQNGNDNFDKKNQKVTSEPKKWNFKSAAKINLSWNKIVLIILSAFMLISIILIPTIGLKLGLESAKGTEYDIKLITPNDQPSKDYAANKINELIKNDYNYKLQLDYYTFELDQNSEWDIVVDTNLVKGSKSEAAMYHLLVNNAKDIGFVPTDPTAFHSGYVTHSASFNETIIQLLIIFGILLLVILLYVLIRFNWAQYIAILGSLIFVVIITILLFNMSRSWITIDVLIALMGVVLYTLVEGIVISGKVKSEKQRYGSNKFVNIYNNFIIYNSKKKKFKRFKKEYISNKTEKLILSSNEFSNKEFKNEIKKIKQDFKKIKINDKKDLKVAYKKYFKEYKNVESNFLVSIRKTIYKDSFKRAFICSIFFTAIFFVMIIFGGIPLSFGLIILFGINLSLYSSIFIMISIWEYFDKYNELKNIRINIFLDKHKLSLDEESIIGVNI